MKKNISKFLLGSALLVMFAILFTDVKSFALETQKDPLERLDDDGDTEWVVRKDFGLIAKDVEMVRTWTEDSFGAVFIKKKGEDFFREVNLRDHQENAVSNYTTYKVTKSAKNIFPLHSQMFILNNQNQLRFTGEHLCYSLFHHKSKKDCKKSDFNHKDMLVKKKIKQGWSDNGTFAFVKNNALTITGDVLAQWNKYKCYEQDWVATFFKGKGNTIKKVVCGQCDGARLGNVFVLMKDGSVWGMGSNQHKMITNSKRKKYSSFVKMIKSGVKDIEANDKNVAIIKKNNELWVWGRMLTKTKKKDSRTPHRIAKDVTEMSLVSNMEESQQSVILFLKKNHVAYGLGRNEDYAFTKNYRKNWYSKPQKLGENVKHIYATNGMTFLLNQQDELYWTGTQEYYSQFDWVQGNTKKKNWTEQVNMNRYDFEPWNVIRKNFGLIATDVSSVKTGRSEVLIQKKNESSYKEINFFEKNGDVSLAYSTNTITQNVKEIFPLINRIAMINQQNRLLLTGKSGCDFFANHTSKTECKNNSNSKLKNVLIKENINKCWGDLRMFAFVEDNSLKITGGVLAPKGKKCYQYNTVGTYFKGKGNKIKKVVSGSPNRRGHVFVLMNDGSVWGMGDNECHAITNKDKEYYNKFVKIISSGASDIEAMDTNLAIIKTNGDLLLWGQPIEKGRYRYARPIKIAKNVIEVSMVDGERPAEGSIIFLTNKGVAYGLGDNETYALTNKYKRKWYEKPVKLLSNVKHVYTTDAATFLLTQQDKLYWTGKHILYGSSYDWVE